MPCLMLILVVPQLDAQDWLMWVYIPLDCFLCPKLIDRGYLFGLVYCITPGMPMKQPALLKRVHVAGGNKEQQGRIGIAREQASQGKPANQRNPARREGADMSAQGGLGKQTEMVVP